MTIAAVLAMFASTHVAALTLTVRQCSGRRAIRSPDRLRGGEAVHRGSSAERWFRRLQDRPTRSNPLVGVLDPCRMVVGDEHRPPAVPTRSCMETSPPNDTSTLAPVRGRSRRAARSAHSALAVAPKSSSTPRGTRTPRARIDRSRSTASRSDPHRNADRWAIGTHVLEITVVTEYTRNADPMVGSTSPSVRRAPRSRDLERLEEQRRHVDPRPRRSVGTRVSSESSRKRLHARSIASISAVKISDARREARRRARRAARPSCPARGMSRVRARR